MQELWLLCSWLGFRFLGLTRWQSGSEIHAAVASTMAEHIPPQPTEHTSMELEESAVDSTAVDSATAAAAAAMSDLSDQASAAIAGQWTRAKLRQLAPNRNHADLVLLCVAHRCE
jgi:hypothetical protein